MHFLVSRTVLIVLFMLLVATTSLAQEQDKVNMIFKRDVMFMLMDGIKENVGKVDQETKDFVLLESIQNYVNPMFMVTGASTEDYVDVIRLLLENGANPNALRIKGASKGASVPVPGAPGVVIRSNAEGGEIVSAAEGGESALAVARKSLGDGHRLVKILVEAGAN